MLVNSQLNILKYFEDVQKKITKNSRPIFNEMFFQDVFPWNSHPGAEKTLQSRCSCIGPGCSSRISCWTWRTHAMFRRDKKKDCAGVISHHVWWNWWYEMKYFVHVYVIYRCSLDVLVYIYRCICLFQRKDVQCCNCKQWQDSSTLNDFMSFNLHKSGPTLLKKTSSGDSCFFENQYQLEFNWHCSNSQQTNV